jgi:hypothetical protein
MSSNPNIPAPSQATESGFMSRLSGNQMLGALAVTAGFLAAGLGYLGRSSAARADAGPLDVSFALSSEGNGFTQILETNNGPECVEVAVLLDVNKQGKTPGSMDTATGTLQPAGQIGDKAAYDIANSFQNTTTKLIVRNCTGSPTPLTPPLTFKFKPGFSTVIDGTPGTPGGTTGSTTGSPKKCHVPEAPKHGEPITKAARSVVAAHCRLSRIRFPKLKAHGAERVLINGYYALLPSKSAHGGRTHKTLQRVHAGRALSPQTVLYGHDVLTH